EMALLGVLIQVTLYRNVLGGHKNGSARRLYTSNFIEISLTDKSRAYHLHHTVCIGPRETALLGVLIQSIPHPSHCMYRAERNGSARRVDTTYHIHHTVCIGPREMALLGVLIQVTLYRNVLDVHKEMALLGVFIQVTLYRNVVGVHKKSIPHPSHCMYRAERNGSARRVDTTYHLHHTVCIGPREMALLGVLIQTYTSRAYHLHHTVCIGPREMALLGVLIQTYTSRAYHLHHTVCIGPREMALLGVLIQLTLYRNVLPVHKKSIPHPSHCMYRAERNGSARRLYTKMSWADTSRSYHLHHTVCIGPREMDLLGVFAQVTLYRNVLGGHKLSIPHPSHCMYRAERKGRLGVFTQSIPHLSHCMYRTERKGRLGVFTQSIPPPSHRMYRAERNGSARRVYTIEHTTSITPYVSGREKWICSACLLNIPPPSHRMYRAERNGSARRVYTRAYHIHYTVCIGPREMDLLGVFTQSIPPPSHRMYRAERNGFARRVYSTYHLHHTVCIVPREMDLLGVFTQGTLYRNVWADTIRAYHLHHTVCIVPREMDLLGVFTQSIPPPSHRMYRAERNGSARRVYSKHTTSITPYVSCREKWICSACLHKVLSIEMSWADTSRAYHIHYTVCIGPREMDLLGVFTQKCPGHTQLEHTTSITPYVSCREKWICSACLHKVLSIEMFGRTQVEHTTSITPYVLCREKWICSACLLK
ncbi:hypothetical protein J6590_097776, partial [Homalodisca vitripennis]